MKKLTGILIAAALVLAPMSASALEMMTDSNMKDVTGQAGVSIAIDDVVIYQQSIADTTYWDTDGNTQYNPNGTVATSDSSYGIQIAYDNNTQKLITIDAIYNESTDGLGGEYNASALGGVFTQLDGTDYTDTEIAADGNAFNEAHALTIDVGTCSVLTAGKSFNLGQTAPVAGVVIGLPTVEIVQYNNANRRAISLQTESGGDVLTTEGQAVNAGKKFIEIEKTGTSKMAILGGTVEIAPH